jgi:hypothetical protein
MVAYGIGVLPLIRRLKQEFPGVKQSWYDNDHAGTGAHFPVLRQFFERLQEIVGPSYGHYPEPSKSILIVQPSNKDTAQKEFQDLGFKVMTGSCYLGGFRGEKDKQDDWMQELTLKWTAAIGELAQAAKLYPQSVYTGLNKLLQQEWQFVQRVCEGILGSFTGVEEALATKFIPELFGESAEHNGMIRKLAALPIKQVGLVLPNPKANASSRYDASKDVCYHLLATFREEVAFSLEDRCLVQNQSIKMQCLQNAAKNKAKLATILADALPDMRQTIKRGQDTGMWLSSSPTTVNGTELSAREFLDALLVRFNKMPTDLPTDCDGCYKPFNLHQALECKKGSLIICGHNQIKGNLVALAAKAFTTSASCGKLTYSQTLRTEHCRTCRHNT